MTRSAESFAAAAPVLSSSERRVLDVMCQEPDRAWFALQLAGRLGASVRRWWDVPVLDVPVLDVPVLAVFGAGYRHGVVCSALLVLEDALLITAREAGEADLRACPEVAALRARHTERSGRPARAVWVYTLAAPPFVSPSGLVWT